MSFVDSRSAIKQLLSQALKPLPLSWIERLDRWEPHSNVRRIARLGLKNRDVTLHHGVGSGLLFNAGDADPDFALGTYELPVQQALATYLASGNTFYDIGANVGFFTVIGAKLVGASGRVYAFEPVPENATCIRRNVKLNHFSNITVFEKAVSSSPGEGELLLTQHPGGNVLSTAYTPPDMKGSMTVELVSIDDLVAQQILAPPTFVKIDVEGAELDVLEGMSKTIQEFKPVILYEADDADEESLKKKSKDLETFISSLGYQIEPLAAAYPTIQWKVWHAVAIPKG
jgi:FkbM family methyltransferase